MPTEEWGPVTWRKLHRRAIAYPEKPGKYDVLKEYNEFIKVIQGIPCPTCISHAMEFIRATPIKLGSSEEYQIWMVDFHNNTNKLLGKKIVEYNEYIDIYSEDRRNKFVRENRPLV